jgi:small-conductance mechanosensitive channel
MLSRLVAKTFPASCFAANGKTWMKPVYRPGAAAAWLFLMAFISIAALYRLIFRRLNFYLQIFAKNHLHTIGIIVQIVLFIWLLLRIIDFIANLLERRANLTADQSDNQLILFFKDFLKVVIGIIGLLMILHWRSITTSAACLPAFPL